MNKIVVGILCGRGDTDEAVGTFKAVRDAGHTGPITPLFGVAPTNKFRGGAYIHMPIASLNKRGLARTELVRRMAKMWKAADLYVVIDDDTRPEPGYFDYLRGIKLPEEPVLMGGKLVNFDGTRSWDVCSFQSGDPVIVPYEMWDHELYNKDLYLSGPQHMFNRSGVILASSIGYPDKEYGEDTNFCFEFKDRGGRIVFIPDIRAKLGHLHNPPNEVDWSKVKH